MAVRARNLSQFFNGKPPAECLYEDDQCIVFEEEEDRQAPVHFFVVPKIVMPRLSEASAADEKLLGHLLLVAKKMAVEKGLQRHGYHVMVDEDYRSSKFKSIHVFGRALHHMIWPTGPGSRL